MAPFPEVGDRAPDFTLPRSRDEKVTLSNVLKDKKAVLLFYVLDFSSPWTNELSRFRDVAPEFEQAGAQLLGINVDSFFSHQAFTEKLGLNFPLLSDFNREVIPQYTGFYETAAGSLKGVGKRAAFVVDRGGVIRYKWVSEEAGVLPNADEILQVAKSLE